jgi:anthranilate synthase/aminodeoxychorismate synthase-like glutamine amidotransferase
MLDLIHAAAGRIPMLGVCLGHQAIGHAFGAKVVSAKRIMHGKLSTIHHDGKGVFQNVPQDFKAVRYHSLALEEATLPDCLEITARSEDGEIMGVRHKELPIEGIQYHPEYIMTEAGRQQLMNFLNRCRGEY